MENETKLTNKGYEYFTILMPKEPTFMADSKDEAYNMSDYYTAYGEFVNNNGVEDEEQLEYLFKVFNMCERPTGYNNRSLSVGDIITFESNRLADKNAERNFRAYICLPMGWKKIELVSK